MSDTISLIDLSENIFFSELNESSETNIPKIHKFLLFSRGSLNDLIQTDYQKNGNDYTPQLSLDAAVVLAALFLDYWYAGQIRSNSGASAWTDWVEIREADTVFRKANRNEVSKTILQLKAQNKEYLNNLINAYKRNRCVPSNFKSGGLWSSICGC